MLPVQGGADDAEGAPIGGDGHPGVPPALEPSGEYFVSWEELRPFVKPEGPLAPILR